MGILLTQPYKRSPSRRSALFCLPLRGYQEDLTGYASQIGAIRPHLGGSGFSFLAQARHNGMSQEKKHSQLLRCKCFLYSWWAVRGSNPRHSACKADALPAELTAQGSMLLKESRARVKRLAQPVHAAPTTPRRPWSPRQSGTVSATCPSRVACSWNRSAAAP